MEVIKTIIKKQIFKTRKSVFEKKYNYLPKAREIIKYDPPAGTTPFVAIADIDIQVIIV